VRDDAVPNTGLIVRNGTLLEVNADLTDRDLAPARVIDLPATETILPGLFDLHAHYAMDLYGEGRIDEHTVNPLVFLANGVTSCRGSDRIASCTRSFCRASPRRPR
jgi:imidazolonepropionase-like amidohydrolase